MFKNWSARSGGAGAGETRQNGKQTAPPAGRLENSRGCTRVLANVVGLLRTADRLSVLPPLKKGGAPAETMNEKLTFVPQRPGRSYARRYDFRLSPAAPRRSGGE